MVIYDYFWLFMIISNDLLLCKWLIIVICDYFLLFMIINDYFYVYSITICQCSMYKCWDEHTLLIIYDYFWLYATISEIINDYFDDNYFDVAIHLKTINE